MKRNVMVILCDQLRKDFLPIYGGDAIDTPNIDELSQNGVTFNNCITQSTVCAPARATMMTGRYVTDHGVWTNDVGFRDGMKYLAEEMNDLGYETGAFGKLHHTPGLDSKGFKHIALMEENRLKEKDHYLQFLKKKHPEVTGEFNVEDSRQFKFDEEDYYECFIADEAIKFIDQHKDQPTFSWVSFQGPHTPYDPPKYLRGKVRRDKLPTPIIRPNRDLSQNAQYRSATRNISEDIEEIMDIREAYAEMIMEIDKQIGKIVTYLKENNLYHNTTIMFSADHGDMLGDMQLGEKGPFLYESQLGIPMVISNHPGVDKNVKSDLLCGNIDITNTVLEIGEHKTGIGYSKSLIGLLDGRLERKVNFSEFCDGIKTVDNGRYRLSYCPFDGYTELYDRSVDPKELKNLSGHQEHIVMENQLLKEIIDFDIIARGVRIETQDLVPMKQRELEHKFPNYLDEFDIVFPVSNMNKYNRIKEAGLDPDYNDFCKERTILASYGTYWSDNTK